MRKDYGKGLHPPKLSKWVKFHIISPWVSVSQSVSKDSMGMCGNESEISVKLHPKNVSKKKKEMERLWVHLIRKSEKKPHEKQA